MADSDNTQTPSDQVKKDTEKESTPEISNVGTDQDKDNKKSEPEVQDAQKAINDALKKTEESMVSDQKKGKPEDGKVPEKKDKEETADTKQDNLNQPPPSEPSPKAPEDTKKADLEKGKEMPPPAAPLDNSSKDLINSLLGNSQNTAVPEVKDSSNDQKRDDYVVVGEENNKPKSKSKGLILGLIILFLIVSPIGLYLILQNSDTYEMPFAFSGVYPTDEPPEPPTRKPTKTPTKPPLQGQCEKISIYKDGSVVDPTTLKTGDQIEVAVDGTNASRARVRLNGGAWEVTNVTNGKGEYIVTFVLPQGVITFTFEAEVDVGGQWK